MSCKYIIKTKDGRVFGYDGYRDFGFIEYNNSNVISLIITDVVDGFINEEEFSNNLIEELKMPIGIKRIGNKAFSNNKIRILTLPEGLVEIGSEAFSNNLIEELEVPSSVKIIYDKAFSNNKIRRLVLPNSLTEIMPESFSNNLIEELMVPSGIKRIYDKAFSNNKIRRLVLPNSLISILSQAFSNNLIEELEIPIGINIIHNLVFYNNKIRRLVLPDNLTEIGDLAFSNNLIEELEIPSKVYYIGSGAFSNNRIKKLILHERIKNIFVDAFAHNLIEELEIPGGVKVIANGAFKSNRIQKLVLHEGLQEIWASAFLENPNLKEVYLPKSVKLIARDSFENLELLQLYAGVKISQEYSRDVRSKISNVELLIAGGTALKDIMMTLVGIYRFFDVDKLKIIGNIDKLVIKAIKLMYPNVILENLDSVKDNINDFEIRNVIDQIWAKCELLSTETSSLIKINVNKLLKEYFEKIKGVAPNFELSNFYTYNLSLESSDPRVIKNQLIVELNSILLNIQTSSKLVEETINLQKMKQLLENTSLIVYPYEVKNSVDKFKILIIVANIWMVKNPKLFNLLGSYVNKWNNQISASSIDSQFITMDDDIDMLYEKIVKLNKFYEAINRMNNSELAQDIKLFQDIIWRLPENEKQVFNTFLDELIDIYSKRILQLEKVSESDFRKDLQEKLVELNLLVNNEYNILFDIKNALKYFDGETVFSDLIVTSVVMEINSIINGEYFKDYEKKIVINKLQQILQYWINKIENDDVVLDNNSILSKDKQIVLQVLKEIYGVKLQVDNYKEKVVEYSSVVTKL